MLRVFLLVFLCSVSTPAQWVNLISPDLSAWEPSGDAVWKVMRDGTLVGQRDIVRNKPVQGWTKEQYDQWLYTQAWLYTRRDFDEYDLHLEYWLRWGGNSGVSIRDGSRARYAVSTPPDFHRTPARVAYEIQLSNHYPDNYPSGSIYLFAKAKPGSEFEDEWNSMDIEVRAAGIRVRLNGDLVAEHPGDPARPKTGPIGLQLHDQYTVAMFRNIRIREAGKPEGPRR